MRLVLGGGGGGEFGGNLTRFDVILVEPPLKEYQRPQGMVFDKYWDWDEVSTSGMGRVSWGVWWKCYPGGTTLRAQGMVFDKYWDWDEVSSWVWLGRGVG